jgi:WD40 repeat protein
VVGAAVWDKRFDYFHIRPRLGLVADGGQQAEKGGPASSGITRVSHFQPHDTAVQGLAVSPDGTSVASVAKELKLSNVQRPSGGLALPTDGVRQLAYSADGRWLAGAGSLGVRIFDPVSGKVRLNLARSLGVAHRVAFSPDSRWLVVAGERLSLLDAGTEKVIKASPPLENVTTLAFAPDGTFLVTGHQDGTILRWPTSDLKPQRQRAANSIAIRSLTFSPQGTYLAAGDDRGTIHLWNAADGSEAGRCVGHVGPVTGLEFVDGQQRIVSAGYDGTIRVWDVKSQKEVDKLTSGGKPVTALAVGGRGRTLASATNDGAVDIWDMPAR